MVHPIAHGSRAAPCNCVASSGPQTGDTPPTQILAVPVFPSTVVLSAMKKLSCPLLVVYPKDFRL